MYVTKLVRTLNDLDDHLSHVRNVVLSVSSLFLMLFEIVFMDQYFSTGLLLPIALDFGADEQSI